jgi:UrcA family protein
MNNSTASPGLRGLAATALFAALAASFTAASAADPRPVSVTVKFADLSVATPSGALALYNRIRAAAQSACSYYWFETDAAEARCVHDAIAGAVTRINQPELSGVFKAQYSTPVPNTLVSQSR